jgi:hypothetical protein
MHLEKAKLTFAETHPQEMRTFLKDRKIFLQALCALCNVDEAINKVSSVSLRKC